VSDTDVQTGPAFRVEAPGRGRGVTTFAAAGIGVVIVALAAAAQLWYGPFVVGAALGFLRPVRARGATLCAVAASLLGWTAPLVWRALRGEPVVATARVAAALAGLPPAGWLVIAAALLVALAQGLLGVWLGRSLCSLFTAPRGKSSRRGVT
jgi:hypothetical protein